MFIYSANTPMISHLPTSGLFNPNQCFLTVIKNSLGYSLGCLLLMFYVDIKTGRWIVCKALYSARLQTVRGLYLVVTKRGLKSWRYNYKIDGKYKTQTYGQYPTIGLAKARLLNSEFKDRVTQGIVNEYPVFLFLAKVWYKKCKPDLNNTKHKLIVWPRADNYILPKIGNLPINGITLDLDSTGMTR